MDDLVSIIMPAFNVEKYIAESIESVLIQTYPHWELIIVDDCSYDLTYKIASEYASKDNRIKVIKQTRNGGVVKARNRAVKEAKGRYIAMLDSDDIWYADKLDSQLLVLKDKECAIVYSSYHKIDENGELLSLVSVPEEVTYATLLKSNYMGCLTVIYDVEKLQKRYFKPMKMSEDYGLWLDILKAVGIAYGVMDSLAQYRVMTQSRSSNKENAVIYQWKIYREREGKNIFKSMYYFTNYTIKGYRRYKSKKLK
ncbi:MAG: glycosyltransferase family 2 protein [Fusobacteria bacterium]|nr:glycosyltransferase family 2 protein [Fusobacteriota bacterium]